MTATRRHLPSVAGCALGFCAAGSGVGFFAGCFVGGQVWTAMSEAEREIATVTSVMYPWMFRGIFAGMVLGVIAGVWYARSARRT